MKNLKTFFSLGLVLFAIQTTQAQNAQFKAGEHSVAIIANPIFDYLGNMFDQDTYNSLYLSSGGVVFRKFKSDTRANRLEVNLSLRNNTYNSVNLNYGYTLKSVNFGFGAGKEYRKSFNNLCVYGGWLAGGFVGSSSTTFTYFEPPVEGESRETERNDGDYIGLRFSGFFGTEYYFSPHFFVGVELKGSANVAYNFAESITSESYTESGNILITNTETLSSEDFISVYVNTDNLVLFFVGVKF